MDGVHDLGGVHGLGRVQREEHEPVFHAPWEKTVYGLLFGTVRTGLINIDAYRHGIERMPPVRYLASRYYEHTLYSIERNLVELGVIAEDELEARTQRFKQDPAARPPRTENPELTERVRQIILRGRASTEVPIEARPRFKPGDHVVTRNLRTKGHTRLPRYARGKHGVIARTHGAFIFPDTNAHGRGKNPQYVYSVRFAGRELWGDESDPHVFVHLDLWESYLEPA